MELRRGMKWNYEPNFGHPAAERFTEQQLRVLALVAGGYQDGQIAVVMGLGEQTVEYMGS